MGIHLLRYGAIQKEIRTGRSGLRLGMDYLSVTGCPHDWKSGSDFQNCSDSKPLSAGLACPVQEKLDDCSDYHAKMIKKREK